MEENRFLYKSNTLYFYSGNPKGKNSIVLMHGYSFNSEVWSRVGLIDTLESMGYRTFSIDVPGFPNSRSKFILKEEEFTDMLNVFIDDVVKSGSLPVLLGSSESAYRALRFAESWSTRISSLIVVAPVKLDRVNIGKIIVPVLGIWGSDDDISPPSEARKYFNRSNSQMKVIEGTGHACYLNKPEEFNEIIKSFLSGL
jgi:pimeloyl-ACP methyl ester carboxylesterase